ncbi:MAG: hypothetical protein ACREBU_10210 [Nitrososphaera sp.]
MGLLNIDSHKNASEVYDSAHKIIRATSLEIKETSPNQKIIAGGERQYDTTILIILLLIVGVFALIYYFTRKKNSLTMTITPRDQGCNINIMAEGPKAEALLQFLSEMLR